MYGLVETLYMKYNVVQIQQNLHKALKHRCTLILRFPVLIVDKKNKIQVRHLCMCHDQETGDIFKPRTGWSVLYYMADLEICKVFLENLSPRE